MEVLRSARSHAGAETGSHDDRGERRSSHKAHLLIAPVGTHPHDRRKPSRSRTQGCRIPKRMWPTEDDEMRRFAAGQVVCVFTGATTQFHRIGTEQPSHSTPHGGTLSRDGGWPKEELAQHLQPEALAAITLRTSLQSTCSRPADTDARVRPCRQPTRSARRTRRGEPYSARGALARRAGNPAQTYLSEDSSEQRNRPDRHSWRASRPRVRRSGPRAQRARGR